MPNVLIVEDSKVVGSIIKKKIESELHFSTKWVHTFAEARDLLEKYGNEFFICLVGLYLPDSPNAEIVDYVISRNMPTIVFTGELSDAVREKVWSKKVIDYVIKEGGYNLDYVIHLISRVYKNRLVKVLAVDDSMVFLSRVSDLLSVHQYHVFQASDGVQALNILNSNPDIKLVITDYSMPNMDGFQLVKEIRTKFSKEDISVIGMSGDNLLAAKFIKLGANDFLSKEFFTEEFYCRITQNIEAVEHITKIKESSNKDYLTGLYNRRYFYDVGQKLFENAERKNLSVTVTMLDIDFFKKINDKYGHDAGDVVLKNVAQILQSRFRSSDVVARFGGEEFCVLAVNMEPDYAELIFEELRKKIEETEVASGTENIKVTVSIGVCTKQMDSLDEMIKFADKMLYKAKESGRNRVVL